MEIKRGDIFFIAKGNSNTIGSEQYPDRPAIIVSNDKCNEYSPCVEIVYMTTQEKKPLPTHVEVMCHVPSIALCEGVQTISKDRVGDYIRSCTDREMRDIDDALLISLGLDSEETNYKVVDDIYRESEELIALQTKCELYKHQYEALLEKVIGR